MVKSNVFEDAFERLVEQSQTVGKKIVKSAAKTVDPQKILEQMLAIPQGQENSANHQEKSTKTNHTPLDFEKLGKVYQDQERQKTEALKHHLFRLVKEADEKLALEEKKEEEQKKQQEILIAQEKKKKEEEKKKQAQMAEIPKGKIRRSIFTPLKTTKHQTAEIKPAIGKQ